MLQNVCHLFAAKFVIMLPCSKYLIQCQALLPWPSTSYIWPFDFNAHVQQTYFKNMPSGFCMPIMVAYYLCPLNMLISSQTALVYGFQIMYFGMHPSCLVIRSSFHFVWIEAIRFAFVFSMPSLCYMILRSTTCFIWRSLLFLYCLSSSFLCTSLPSTFQCIFPIPFYFHTFKTSSPLLSNSPLDHLMEIDDDREIILPYLFVSNCVSKGLS